MSLLWQLASTGALQAAQPYVACDQTTASFELRVCLQDMTYVKQLENYEEEVMRKRLEEMPESEREKLLASVETERERRQARQQQLQELQQQQQQQKQRR